MHVKTLILTCRSLYSIVQTCAATIFACVWVAVHRNIPAPKTKVKYSSNRARKAAQWLWSKICDQRQSVIVFLVTLLAPEWILAWAAQQALRARELATELEDARMEAKKRWEESHPEFAKEPGAEEAKDEENRSTGVSLRSSSEDELLLIEKRAASSSTSDSLATHPEDQSEWTRARSLGKLDQSWTIALAFFVIMGGYHAYNEDGPLYPLSPDAVVSLVRDGKLIPPTTEELSDKSKGDVLSKGVAILQTFWFVVQCVARLAEHLPLTNLEVMTLAYTVMTVAMYIAWWHKPLNVSCAIRTPAVSVSTKVDDLNAAWEWFLSYIMGAQDGGAELSSMKRVPTFWAGKASKSDLGVADCIALLVAMAFGAVHFIAWSYAFTSHIEQLMWRASAIAIVAVPPGILLALYLAEIESGVLSWAGISLTLFFTFIGAPLYICARMILLIFSFTTLTSLPHSIYQTVQWAEFIPHI
ncbi:hypothetical protein HWV62_30713 [Athelia sp. TMB]|nr:hypothetical protein HWV62_30713 [Athelia sp. TMB]